MHFRLTVFPSEIFVWTSLETFSHTQVWNLKYLSLKIVLFLLLFAVIFANFSPIFHSYVIIAKYILLKLKAPWAMSAISENYNRVIIFWNLQIFYKMFFSQKVKRKVVITNKNGEYELNDELQTTLDLKSQNSMEL